MKWEKYSKEHRGPHAASAPPSVTEFFSLRPTGVGFSSAFTRKAIGEHMRVSILTDERDRRLGFQFHSNVGDSDSYPLSIDGAGGGRMLQVARIYDKYPWLRTGIGQRFHPKHDTEASLWFVVVPRTLRAVGAA